MEKFLDKNIQHYFSKYEIQVLEKWGRLLERLATREVISRTKTQREFQFEIAKGLNSTSDNRSVIIWLKYLAIKNLIAQNDALRNDVNTQAEEIEVLRKKAVKEIESYKEYIFSLSDSEWKELKSKYQQEYSEKSKKRREIRCSCNGLWDGCCHCDGKGYYLVDENGYKVY